MSKNDNFFNFLFNCSGALFKFYKIIFVRMEDVMKDRWSKIHMSPTKMKSLVCGIKARDAMTQEDV